ncbi:MAG: division/cell wall cluster transcriptional repressor MraZ [Bacteroidales bacterium]|jgi:MraZ protein|nr:division/cell wall cluster transcriptional repressor MraZ [Bacteroidales bacterium]
MTNLIGVFELKVDAKGRFIFPSALKKQMGEALAGGFVMKKSIFQQCIELYPITEWNEETMKVNRLNRFVKKNNDFIRLFMSGSRQVMLDEAGRLLIPKDLLNFSGVSKSLVVASSINRLEIWSKELYEQVLDSGVSSFENLAEEVMGQLGNEMET